MEIIDTIKQFDIKEKIIGYSPLGNGHINATYLVSTVEKKYYVLQRINTNAFSDVDLLMNNINLTTRFLSQNGYETLEIVPTKSGKLYFKCEDGCFRIYTYINDVVCYEGVDDLEAVYSTAKAFGRLHKSLHCFPARSLAEVIPDFHNTEKRYIALLDAYNKDVCYRAFSCQEEMKQLSAHKEEYKLLPELMSKDIIQLGVTHNDPKINNVLFDKKTNQIRAVIDLDTMMPGSYLYDYGDALRSLFTGEYEDSKDLEKIKINYNIFEAYTRGYLSETKGLLNNKEIELLPFSIFLLASELSIRFLTDYLNGDRYFKVEYHNHNLVRARTQLKLANEVYQQLNELKAIVQKILSE